MLHRWSIATVAFILVLTAVALGARATALLDGIETALADAAAALEGDTTKQGKRKLKTATQGLAKLGKVTASELDDVKLLKKIAGGVLKRFADDAVVTQAVVASADDAEASIDADIDATRGRVAGKRVTAAKVSKAVDRAQTLLDKSRAKSKTKARISVLFKARKVADKAAALADKLGAGTGELDVAASVFVITPDGGGAFRLRAINTTTGSLTAIDTGAGEVSLDAPTPALSPDRTTLAIAQDMKLVFVDLSGDPDVVTTEPSAAWEYSAWSPNSLLLAASGVDPDTLAIFDSTGATVRSVADEVRRGTPDTETLLWSRDSAHLAYRTDRDTNGVKELRVLNVATGDVVEVSGPSLTTDQIRYVAWSPVADRLVYVANEESQTSDAELVAVDPDGGNATTLSVAGEDVRDADVTSSIAVNPSKPSVLYEFRSGGMGRLGTVDLDGTDHHVIATATASFFSRFAWSPDGARVAYLDGRSLHTVAPDGTGDVEVSATCVDFLWSADGMALLYREGNGGSLSNELFAAGPDGSDPARVSPDPADVVNVEPGYTTEFTQQGLVRVTFVSRDNDLAPFLHSIQISDGNPSKVNADREYVLAVYRAERPGLAVSIEVVEKDFFVFEGERIDIVTVLLHDSFLDEVTVCTYAIAFKYRDNGTVDPEKTRTSELHCRVLESDEARYIATVAARK